MSDIKRDTFHWVPLETVTTPPDNAHLLHMRGMWWVTNVLGEVLLYRGRDGYDHAQANPNHSIAERLLTTYAGIGADGLVFIEHGFLPDDPGRYRD